MFGTAGSNTGQRLEEDLATAFPEGRVGAGAEELRDAIGEVQDAARELDSRAVLERALIQLGTPIRLAKLASMPRLTARRL